MNKATPWPDRLHQFNRRRTRYAEALAWMLRDGLLRFRRRITVMVVSNLAGIGLQVAAFGLLFGLARAFERDTPLRLFGWSMALQESPAALAGVSALVALLLAAAAGLIYRARTGSIGVRRSYEAFCSRRALLLASRLPLPTAEVANRILADSGVSAIAHKHARLISRVLYVLINGLLPVGRALIALGVLCMIRWSWTAVVLGLAPVAGYLLYGINVSAARASWRRDRHAGPAAQARRRLMQRLRRSSAPLEESESVLKECYHRGAGGKAADSFYERFLIRERAQLVSNLFTALVVLAVLLVAGTEVFRGGMSWAVFAAFLVALRVLLMSLRGVVAVFVQVSRFYPSVRDYMDFVQDARRAEQTVQPAQAARTVELDVPGLEAGGGPLRVEPGGQCWWLSPDGVDRALAARLQLHTVAPDGGVPAAYWFTAEPAELEQARCAPHSAVLVPACLLDSLAEDARRSWLAAVAPRVLVRVVEQPDRLGTDEDRVLLLDGDEAGRHGWCTAGWLRAHPEFWTDWLARRAAAAPAGGDGGEEDDDDDE